MSKEYPLSHILLKLTSGSLLSLSPSHSLAVSLVVQSLFCMINDGTLLNSNSYKSEPSIPSAQSPLILPLISLQEMYYYYCNSSKVVKRMINRALFVSSYSYACFDHIIRWCGVLVP